MKVNGVTGLQALLDAELEGPAVVVHVASVPSIGSAPAILDLLVTDRDRGWICTPLPRLTDLSCLALELRRIDDDIIGRLTVNPSDRDALLLLHSSAWTVRHLGKVEYNKERFPLKACTRLSNRILYLTRRAIKRKKIEWLQEHLPNLSNRIDHILNIGMPLSRSDA